MHNSVSMFQDKIKDNQSMLTSNIKEVTKLVDSKTSKMSTLKTLKAKIEKDSDYLKKV